MRWEFQQMSNCKNCGGEIPINHAQIGGVHMACEHDYFHVKNQRMTKIRPIGGGQWCVQSPNEVVPIFADGDEDSHYEIKIVMMSKGEIEALPEFDGW